MKTITFASVPHKNEAIAHLRDKTGQLAATSEMEWLLFFLFLGRVTVLLKRTSTEVKALDDWFAAIIL